MGIRCAYHVTPLYPQKLALTSPTGGGRSVGIVRSRTKATELVSLASSYMSVCVDVRLEQLESRWTYLLGTSTKNSVEKI